jgi:hypothetical protein
MHVYSIKLMQKNFISYPVIHTLEDWRDNVCTSVVKICVLTLNKAKFFKIFIITLVLRKTPIFSPKIVKNRRKL